MTDLEQLDTALIALRHLWTAPGHIEDPALGRVEMSTIWVVDSLRRHDDRTVTELAAAMGVAQSTGSRLVQRAEQAGAVTRTSDPTDQRRITVTLTTAGRDLADTALSYRLQRLADTTSAWSAAERHTFATLLTRFATGLPTGEDTA